MRTSLCAVSLVSLLTPSCFLQRSAADIASFERHGTIRGVLDPVTPSGAPVVLHLLAYDAATDKYPQYAHRIRYEQGPFEFLCAPGEYFLIAFEDTNQDLAFQEEERVGWHAIERLTVGPGETIDGLAVTLRTPEEGRAALPVLYGHAEPFPPIDLAKDRLGEVVSPDDPRLAEDAGTLGMWEPVRFLNERNSGIYFLEPYAPDKTPVVFVHGIKGYGGQFRSLIESLDRERYQPWIVQYASGLRIDIVAEHLAQALLKLKLRHDVGRMHLVAHSMGGLTSRAMLNALHRDGHRFVDLFVTYSTPWGGHAAAQSGVDWSPAVVPCWYDMVPESPFLAQLFDRPLPDDLPHWLAFGYRGDPSMFIPEQNDTVVTIKSQLRPDAQRGALRVTGFDEDHATILTCDRGIAFLGEALKSVKNGN